MSPTWAATRLRWSLSALAGHVDVLAEPEAAKAGYAVAAELTDGELAKLGVADPTAFRARLNGESSSDGVIPIQDLDAAALWQACAPSLISRYGQSETLALAAPQAPNARRFAWRAGNVWRIRVASPDGWSDDRLVRFTGDTLHKGKPGRIGPEYPELEEQLNSIGPMLDTLPSDTRVLPGQGEETTVGEERSQWESWFALAQEPESES